MLGNRLAGVWHVDGGKFVGSEECDLCVVFIGKHRTELFILLHVDGAIAMSAGQDATFGKGFLYLVVDMLVVVRMMSQTEAYGTHHGHEVECQQPLWSRADKGRHDD